jgi:hypothetical protein
MKRSIRYSENNFASLFNFTRWINRQKRNWKQVRIRLRQNGGFNDDHRILGAGETKEVSVKVQMNRLKAEELRVELILERQDAIHGHRHMEIYPMGLIGQCGDSEFEYRARVKAKRDGSYRFNCRVIPTNPDLFNPHETRLIKWLD